MFDYDDERRLFSGLNIIYIDQWNVEMPRIAASHLYNYNMMNIYLWDRFRSDCWKKYRMAFYEICPVKKFKLN